jgi:hypothetical protein
LVKKSFLDKEWNSNKKQRTKTNKQKPTKTATKNQSKKNKSNRQQNKRVGNANETVKEYKEEKKYLKGNKN